MKPPFDFGAALRDLRRQKGYTQKRLAEVLNLSETTISKYESNTAVPPFETVRAIAAWFHVSIDSLAGNAPSDTIALYGLTDAQAVIIKDLIAHYQNKNAGSSTPPPSCGDYELLGRIVESFFSKE